MPNQDTAGGNVILPPTNETLGSAVDLSSSTTEHRPIEINPDEAVDLKPKPAKGQQPEALVDWWLAI